MLNLELAQDLRTSQVTTLSVWRIRAHCLFTLVTSFAELLRYVAHAGHWYVGRHAVCFVGFFDLAQLLGAGNT